MKPPYNLLNWIFLSITMWNICFCSSNENQISFYLYTSFNPGNPQQIYLNDISRIEKSHFSSQRKTKVLIHGWNADYISISIRPLKQAYLATGDYNIIAVDCKSLANPNYITARAEVKIIAEYIAKFLDFLVEAAKTDPKEIHLLGHSLGAHIAGLSGRYSKYKVSRVTGLDPALPLFDKRSNDQLKETDGKFVDVIHTCGGYLGMMEPVGNADFYPNGGTPSQPGCSDYDSFAIGGCSHMRAPYYYSETIMNPNAMIGVQCSSYQNFIAQKCNNNSMIPMGENTPQSVKHGLYYLQTRNLAPFGMGNVSRYFKSLD